MQLLVLGAGRVGGAMAIDLSKDERFAVAVADRDPSRLEALKRSHGIEGRLADLSSPDELRRVLNDADFVISAVPGFLGFQTLHTVIECGKNVIDIAFFPEDPFELDSLAKARGVTAIVDCGVAPGMSNLLIGHVAALLDRTERASIYVGGLPVRPEKPYEYKAVFSPIDVIEEYTRPARIVEDGRLVVRPPLTEIEHLDFPEIGTLEAFNSDGLRTLAETIDAPNLVEKTMRYPGHAEKMALLRDTGFFSTEPVRIGDVDIRPMDLTAALLFPLWQMSDVDEDVTVMRVTVEGVKDGRNLRYTYDLLDRFDKETRTTSMARTTGYTATVAARMLIEGIFEKQGVFPPEIVGRDAECVRYLLAGLEQRNIHYKETVEVLASL